MLHLHQYTYKPLVESRLPTHLLCALREEVLQSTKADLERPFVGQVRPI